MSARRIRAFVSGFTKHVCSTSYIGPPRLFINFYFFHVHTVTCTRLRPVNYMGCEKGRRKNVLLSYVLNVRETEIRKRHICDNDSRASHIHIVHYNTCVIVYFPPIFIPYWDIFQADKTALVFFILINLFSTG